MANLVTSKNRKQISGIKLVAVFFLLVLPTACAQLQPAVRDKGPSPFTYQDRKDGEKEDTDTRKTDLPAGQEDQNATQILQELEKENEAFNQRLNSIMQATELEKDKPGAEGKKRDVLPSEKKEVSFNFYDADLVEVIRVFMDMIQGDYVLHPDVSGRVSLSVDDTFHQDQLVGLLQGLLRINNMTMFKGDEGIWEILPMSEASRQLTDDKIFIQSDTQGQKRGQIIQVFRLHFIAATEMIKILEPYLTQSATVYAHDEKGVLLICDYPHALTKVEQMVDMFDESVFANIYAQVYTLKYAQAEEAVEELQDIADNFGLSADDGGPHSRVAFVPLVRTNTVVAITHDPKVMEFVQAWVQELDKKVPTALSTQQEPNVYVYYVQYGDADLIVESLEGVFGDIEQETEEETKKQRVAGEMEEEAQKKEQVSKTSTSSGKLTGSVTFQVDETTNSILTRCNAQDYSKIHSVIQKIDLYPKQVFIEMVIAEVSLNDSSKLGVEWSYLMDVGSDAKGLVSLDSGLGVITDGTSQIGSGLSYVVEKTNRLTAALKALAESGEVNILSTPTLLASDNKEATINIGDEVPIPTTTEQRTDTSADRLTTTTLQYRDTGIIMKVTPKINKQGMVRMEIEQEVSNLSTQSVEGVRAPIISTRNSATTVAVMDKQTIVIGGLIQQTRSRSNSGIPFLRNIPGLGHLFSYQEDSRESTELMVFITPHVVLSQTDTRLVTRDFKARLDEIKDQMFVQ
ncbi:MAG: type II secretion system secretin GspD [Desulfovermiculus sp.]|nr:type II secretion system secretin GspD [Desulfovermiculus sp.]